MQVEWYGQAAFRLSDGERTVFIDPFGDVTPLRERGIRWDYPAIAGVSADLVLVTHEHVDHNAVEVIGGSPTILRSTAGRLESPVGEILAIAAEHDVVAGTDYGPNTLFALSLDGLRVAHLGDLGQRALRPEQLEALGDVDLLLAPVGAGPTIGPEQAWEIAQRVGARVVVPMHYRTERLEGFLDPVDPFLALAARVQRLDMPVFDTGDLPDADGDGPLVVVPAAP
jgi:L-ascorbate metabolism protein UlaG (beta-lactamase superfamily)